MKTKQKTVEVELAMAWDDKTWGDCCHFVDVPSDGLSDEQIGEIAIADYHESYKKALASRHAEKCISKVEPVHIWVYNIDWNNNDD